MKSLGQNSLIRYSQVSSRWTTMAFYDVQNLPQGFPRKHTKAIAVDQKLTWQHLLSEFRPKQTKAVCVN